MSREAPQALFVTLCTLAKGMAYRMKEELWRHKEKPFPGFHLNTMSHTLLEIKSKNVLHLSRWSLASTF